METTIASATVATSKEYGNYVKQVLVEFLKECHGNNKTASYRELSGIAGFDVTTPKGRYYLSAARQILQERIGLGFETVPRVGCRPIAVGEMATRFGTTATQKISQATTQFRSNLSTIDTGKLTDQKDIQAYIKEQVRCSFYEQAARDEQYKVDAAVEKQQKTIEANQDTIKQSILAAFQGLQ